MKWLADLEEALRGATTREAMMAVLARADDAGMTDDAWHTLAAWADDSDGCSANGLWTGVMWLDDGAAVLTENSDGFRDASVVMREDAEAALAEAARYADAYGDDADE